MCSSKHFNAENLPKGSPGGAEHAEVQDPMVRNHCQQECPVVGAAIFSCRFIAENFFF